MSTPGALVLIPSAVLGLVVLGLAARRWPGVGCLVARSIARRRVEAVLVVLGSALGTALITGSLLVGDTIDASLRDRALERLGPVDVVVGTFVAPVADATESLLAAEPPPETDGVLSVTVADATLSTPGAGPGQRHVVPTARLLETDFQAARSFGGDPDATGIEGPTPGPGGVALGEDAASRLGVAAGDSIEAYTYGQFLLLRVERVLPRVGVAGYATEFDEASMNAFVAPGTIARLAGSPGVSDGARPPERLVLLSATGGVFDGAERTDDLVEHTRDRLSTLVGVEVSPVKRDLLDVAREEGDAFAELFLSLGAFAVLAGAALLVNTLVMLAEGRRRELGVLRSLGMSRRAMVGMFFLEGAAYSVLASALGALAGIGVARVVVALAGGILSSPQRGGVEALRLGFEPVTLLVGALGGLLISLAVVFATGFWIGRTSIVEAIDDLARRPERGPRGGGMAFASLGVLFFAASVVSVILGEDLGSLIFPCLTLAFFAAALRGLPRGRSLADGAVVAVMLWAVVSFGLLNLDGDDVVLFVAQGLALSLSAVVLLVGHQARIGGRLRRLGGGLALHLATAYPSARRLRTGATLLAYGLIVFTLVFSSVLSGVFSGQKEQVVRDEAGGFDVLVSTGSADPVSAGELASARGVENVAPMTWTFAGLRVGHSGEFRDWPVSGFDRALLEGGPPALETFDTHKYPSEEAVWEAVAADPKLAIADVAFLQRGGGPPESNVAVGQEIEARSPATGQTVRREVVAISAAGAAFSGVMVSQDSLAELAGDLAVNRHYLAVSGGSNPDAVAADLQRSFLPNGLEARSFEGVVESALRDQEEFFDLIEGYLAIGLLVGIGSLGVVMVRAVGERRRQIGVLRALGFPASAVRGAFLFESGLVAIEGTLIGAALALGTGYQLVTFSTVFGEAGADFYVPWAQLVLLPAGVLLASLLVALPSAVRATGTPPAAVLRTDGEGTA